MVSLSAAQSLKKLVYVKILAVKLVLTPNTFIMLLQI